MPRDRSHISFIKLSITHLTLNHKAHTFKKWINMFKLLTLFVMLYLDQYDYYLWFYAFLIHKIIRDMSTVPYDYWETPEVEIRGNLSLSSLQTHGNTTPWLGHSPCGSTRQHYGSSRPHYSPGLVIKITTQPFHNGTNLFPLPNKH